MAADETVTPVTKKRGCGFYILVGLAIVIGLGVIGTIFGPTPEERAVMQAERAREDAAEDAQEAREEATQRTARRDSATRVTVVELFRAYQANEARAQSNYGDRLLEVTGTVSGVDLDLTNDPVVQLRTDNEFMSAQAQIVESEQPRASELDAGQSVTLLCESVSEVIGVPMLNDCSFVEPRAAR